MCVNRLGPATRRYRRFRSFNFIVITPTIFLGGCGCFAGHTAPVYWPAASVHFAEDFRHAGNSVGELPADPIAVRRDRVLPSHLLKVATPPNCKFESVKKPPAESGVIGSKADQELLDVARLRLERDCLRNAEKKVRRQLEQLQDAVAE